MTTSSLNPQKPGLVTAVAVMTLISGIINLFWGFVASLTALGTLVGIVCLPLTILPTILGIVEIVYAAKLLSAQPQPVQPSQSIAILEILCLFVGNVFSMVVGILALVFYNDLAVKDYFARLNGTPAPAGRAPSRPPVSPAPASLPQPARPRPEPVEGPMQGEPAPGALEAPVEPAVPEPEKKPAKPRPKPKGPRKVARK